MNQITERGLRALNLELFAVANEPLLVHTLNWVECPLTRQYVLRTLVKKPFEELAVPDFLNWANPIINASIRIQEHILKIRQPFCYVTVRHGVVESQTDDEWHVDGFSMGITHLPEQNYVWTSHTPTEYIVKGFDFPRDFNPLKHNIHQFFQDNITAEDKIHTCEAKGLYLMDPYVIHRRPQIKAGVVRTFVRVSFTPINDCNNTINPLVETNYKRDAVKEFRNNLTRYQKT